MCEITTVLLFVAPIVAASFCIGGVHTEEKLGEQKKDNKIIFVKLSWKVIASTANAIISGVRIM